MPDISIDTKSKGSDPEAPNKHKALLVYCERENGKQTDRKLIESIIIPEEIAKVLAWRYCREQISDTHVLKDWDYFNPANIGAQKTDGVPLSHPVSS